MVGVETEREDQKAYGASHWGAIARAGRVRFRNTGCSHWNLTHAASPQRKIRFLACTHRQSVSRRRYPWKQSSRGQVKGRCLRAHDVERGDDARDVGDRDALPPHPALHSGLRPPGGLGGGAAAAAVGRIAVTHCQQWRPAAADDCGRGRGGDGAPQRAPRGRGEGGGAPHRGPQPHGRRRRGGRRAGGVGVSDVRARQSAVRSRWW